MNELWMNLKQPEYLHVVINHLPITGLAVATLGLLISLITHNRGGAIICVWLVFITTLSVWPVIKTGEMSYDDIYAKSDTAGENYLDHHMHLAEKWAKAFYITAGISAIALLVYWRSTRTENMFGWIVFIGALGCVILSGWIAETGGKVIHQEFRATPAQPSPDISK